MISSPVNRSTGELAWALSNMSQAPTPKSPCTLRKCCQRWLVTAIGIQDRGCGNNPQGHGAWRLRKYFDIVYFGWEHHGRATDGCPFSYTQYVSGCIWIPLCIYTFTVHQRHNLNPPRFAHGGIIERQRHFGYWTRTQEWGAKLLGNNATAMREVYYQHLRYVVLCFKPHGSCTYSSWHAHFLPIKRRGAW